MLSLRSVPRLLALLLAACGSPPAPSASPAPIAPEPLAAAPVDSGAAAAEPAPAATAKAPEASPAYSPLAGFEGAFVVNGVPAAVRVSVGGPYDCALTREGSVWCWRGKRAEEAGGEPPPFAVPAVAEGLGRVAEFSAGLPGVCGVGAAVRCVGSELAGDVIGLPPALPDVRSLSLGMEHGCAVRRGGRVRCWGSREFGRLGTGDSEVESDVPGVQQAVEVAAGAFGACAVERSGGLVCWGAASLSAWVPGGRGYRPPKATGPTALRGVRDVTHVSLRGEFPCLARRSGRVLCWSPEDAATLLPQNPLPASSEVRGVSDAVAVSGTLVRRQGGRLASVEQGMDEKGWWFEAKALGEGALGEVIDADGVRSGGCAVESTGRVVCWGM